MFAIERETEIVLFDSDPRNGGCTESVIDDVRFSEDVDVYDWPDGTASPEPVHGKSPIENDYHYFRTIERRLAAGFIPCKQVRGPFPDWRTYIQDQ
jgi:hypothetical protein